jgi:hypothetical protein
MFISGAVYPKSLYSLLIEAVEEIPNFKLNLSLENKLIW